MFKIYSWSQFVSLQIRNIFCPVKEGEREIVFIAFVKSGLIEHLLRKTSARKAACVRRFFFSSSLPYALATKELVNDHGSRCFARFYDQTKLTLKETKKMILSIYRWWSRRKCKIKRTVIAVTLFLRFFFCWGTGEIWFLISIKRNWIFYN